MWGGFQSQENALTEQPTKFLAILKSKQASRPADFMAGFTIMIKEGDKPNSKKSGYKQV